jgi:hypothetical protein
MPDPMADHWGYVLGAYAVTAAALLGYWRHLVTRSRAINARQRGKGRRA